MGNLYNKIMNRFTNLKHKKCHVNIVIVLSPIRTIYLHIMEGMLKNNLLI